MCCSLLGQIIFGAVMFCTLGLTLAAMFTPGWRDFKQAVNVSSTVPKSSGLFPFLCQTPSESNEKLGTDEQKNKTVNYCEEWWNKLPGYEKAVIVAMSAAVVIEIIACVWTIFSILACCCKSFIMHPLPAFSTLVALFLAVAIGLYGSKHKDSIDLPESMKKINDSSEIGYSFYMACGALAGAIIDIIVGTVSVALAKRCL